MKSVGLYALLAMLTLASSALAQPPVARTKPMIDHQLAVEARHDKRVHEKAHEQQLRAQHLMDRRQQTH